MNRRILISCVVLALVFCLVLSVIAIAGAGFLVFRSASSQTQGVDTPPMVEPVLADGSLSPQVLAEMELIQRQVIRERGLTPDGEFSRAIFSPEDLQQRVLNDFAEDYTPEEAQTDVIALAAFGLVDPEFEFYDFYLALLSEQIAGFYDNETKEMVIVQGKGWGGPERMTYAHEYVHALQDQNYNFREGLQYSEEGCENESERCAAIQALVEGDATLAEINWFSTHASASDRAEVMDFYDNYESPILDSAPSFLYQDFLFPYEKGYEFVQYLHDQGGWGAVDAAYTNLPVSTEQILHPEKYPADTPQEVTLPDLASFLGTGWEELDQGEMGEWYTFLILAHGDDEDARLKVSEASQAAEGWGGDAYAVYYQAETDSTVMAMLTNWDSPAEADEFGAAFTRYLRGRFGRPETGPTGLRLWPGDAGVHGFWQAGERSLWLLAPSQEIAIDLFDLLALE